MPSLKDGLRELFPTTDLETSARSRSGARLVSGRREPEMPEENYLPLLALILGGVILAIAVTKPNRNVGAALLGQNLQANLPQGENPYQNQPSQQQDASYQGVWPEE